MAFRVETAAAAEQDVEAIFEWLISRNAGEAGLRWLAELEDAIASLNMNPQRCPIAPENGEFPFEVRQLFYGRQPNVYRILFTINRDVVYVFHVRHGRRRPLGERHV